MSKQKITIFSKPDEMGRRIQYRAMWITLVTINAVWVIHAIYLFIFVPGGTNVISGQTLLIVDMMYFAIAGFLRLNMTRGGSDKE